MQRFSTFTLGTVWFTLAASLVILAGCDAQAPPDNQSPGGGLEDSTLIDDSTSTDDSTPVDDGALDSDGDGFSDDEEINGLPGTDPYDPTDNPDNVRDTDGDGCSDFDELNFAGFCNNDPNVPVGGGDDGDGGQTDGGGTVSLTGRLQVTSTSVVDGDTADPNNPVVPNNAETLTRVQPLPNPCTVGGFLGLSAQGTDVTDVFRVQLAAGQTVSLMLADPQANDFDLYLYDEEGSPLDSSEGTGKAERVTAPANGTFLAEVYGYSVVNGGDGGGLYTLLIGDAGATAASDASKRLSSLAEFVPGEILVGFNARQTRNQNPPDYESLGLEVVNSATTSGGVERLRINSNVAGARRANSRNAPPGASALQRPTSDTIAAIKELRRRSDVEYAEPNYIRRTCAVPDDEFYPYQWHYPLISLPEAWEVTTGDPDVIVAVIDTGVVLDHPDLQGQLVDGYDFISDPQISRDGDGIDPDPDDPGDLGIQGTTSTFHGTHVAGTVAARSDNGTGVAGVAWNVSIMPIRVLGLGGGTDFDITQGILYAAGLSNSSGTVPAQKADVINMSLGGQGLSSAEQDAILAAREAGVIVIAAAGNESSNADYCSPAGLEGVVTVASVGYTRTAAPYSNYGNTVDLAAPGGDMSVDADGDSYADGVLSTIGRDDGSFTYEFSQGTSMAAPHAAGVAALMRSVNPDLTPDDFDLLLAGNHSGTSIEIADDLGDSGWDETYGYGLINALQAVRAAAEIAGTTVVETPILQVLPRSVDLTSSLTNATVTVSNAGADTLVVTDLTTSDSWLSVSPTSGGAEEYAITADPAALDDGIYTGTVTFTSNGGTFELPVRLTVGTQTVSGGDVGTVYVLVLDLEALATVDQDVTTAADDYEFTFSGVPAGTYGLFAGTDLDNDGFIDNGGEALGGYPTLFDPEQLDLAQDRSGLSFITAYRINVQTPTALGGSSAQPKLRRIVE